MPFPDEELPISVDIAPGASPAASIDSWDPYWVDITRDVRVAQRITIEEGIPDEANQADPGSASMTLNNSASKVASTLGQRGCYVPRNPQGPYWGKLGKNTPLRVRLLRGRDTFARNVPLGSGWGVSDSGIAWSSASGLGVDGSRAYMTSNAITTAVNAGTWDFDLTCEVSVNALPVGGDAYHQIRFRRSGTNNTYIFWISHSSTNTLVLFMQRVLAGVTTTLASPTVATGIPLTAWRVRLKAEGGFLGAKVWRTSQTEPVDWQVNLTGEGAYTLDNTALGTNIQFVAVNSGTVNTTRWLWGDLTINSYPFVGTVSEWPAKWDQSGVDATVSLKATGVLRRLQSGKSPLRSPFHSYIDGLKPAALWTLEDGSGAELAASQTSGVKGATIYETNPSGWDGKPFDGTAGQFTVGEVTTISGTLPRIAPNGSWLAWFTFYMPVLPVTNPLIFRVRASGTIVTWDVRISDDFGGVIYILGVAADGSILVNVSAGYTPGQWVVGQVEIEQVGANMTARIVAYHVTTGVVTGVTEPAIAGNIGAPQGWSVYGSTGFQEGAAGPVAFFPFIPSVNIGSLLAAARGFAGETAEARMARLCAERGIRLDLMSGGRQTLMGPQTKDTLLSVMGEVADTDMGLLTEFRGGLRYRSRGRRYGQNSRMTLDFSLGHIKEPPEPTDDDKNLVNDVTVTRKNGSSARAIDVASIAANDVYDTSVDINPSTDDALSGHAGWRLHLGTWDEMRWPSITLDLARNGQLAGFLERATTLDAGTYVTLNNPPKETPVSSIRLLVEHVQHSLGPFDWTMELTCSPYQPWMVPSVAGGDLDDWRRIDVRDSTLAQPEAANPVGSTQAWTVVNSRTSWSASDVPYYWRVAGEVIRVDAVVEGYWNANPYFGVDTSSWSVVGGSIIRDTTQAHQGSASLRLTPTGAAATARTESDPTIGPVPGESWSNFAWVRCSTARNIAININWFGTGGYLSTTVGAPAAVLADTWTLISVSGTAPASTTSMSISIGMTGTPPATDILWIDEARTIKNGVINQTVQVTRGIEGFTKAHVPGEAVSLAYPLYVGL